MPVSPKRQAELRAGRRDTTKTYPRERCKNCPKFFLKNRANKRFCSDACRKEFFEYGGTAFNQLKPKLEKFVTRWMREYAAHIEARLTAIESKLEQRQQ